jgi:pyridoxine kinase
MENGNVLLSRELTFKEYVSEITQFQNNVCKMIAGKDYYDKMRIDEALFIMESTARKKGLRSDPVVHNAVLTMKKLCKEADFILPNLTEACALASLPYPQTDGEKLVRALTPLCKRPVVTGVQNGKDISVYYTNEQGMVESCVAQTVEGNFHGAGDVFASAFIGALANGKREETAIRLATDFTTSAVRRSAIEVSDSRYGLNFEAEIFSFLKNLNNPLFR